MRNVKLKSEDFYKYLFIEINDQAAKMCPVSDEYQVIELNFELGGYLFEVDVDANVEIVDDSFSHEFGMERACHFAVGEINYIKCRCFDQEDGKEIKIDNSKLNNYLDIYKKLVAQGKYSEAYKITSINTRDLKFLPCKDLA